MDDRSGTGGVAAGGAGGLAGREGGAGIERETGVDAGRWGGGEVTLRERPGANGAGGVVFVHGPSGPAVVAVA